MSKKYKCRVCERTSDTDTCSDAFCGAVADPVSNEPIHPEVTVQLTGRNGNAFAILGACRQAARKVGVSDEEIAAFTKEAQAGDYDNLLRVCMKWFDVQ